MHSVMKTLLCTILIIGAYILKDVNSENPECPRKRLQISCPNSCETDANCTAPLSICCPGICIKGASRDIDNYIEGKMCAYPDKCQTSKCTNGATCVTDFLNINEDGYSCYCRSGYTGIYCEEEIKECQINKTSPCKHGGLCVDLFKDYRCCCPIGFTGKNCEQRISSLCPKTPPPAKSPCDINRCPKYRDYENVKCLPMAEYYFMKGEELVKLNVSCGHP